MSDASEQARSVSEKRSLGARKLERPLPISTLNPLGRTTLCRNRVRADCSEQREQNENSGGVGVVRRFVAVRDGAHGFLRRQWLSSL